MDALVLTLCVFLPWCLLQVLRLVTKRSPTITSHLPPGPRPYPLIGNLLDLGPLPHKSLANLANTYGPIVKLKLGSVTTVVVSSPLLAKEILQTHDTTFSTRMVPDVVTACDHDRLGLAWIPTSTLFRELRKIYNSHITSNRKLDSSQHLRRSKVQELVAYVRKSMYLGEAVDIREAAFRTAVNSLSNNVFSLNLTDSSDSVKELKAVVESIMYVVGQPNLADYFPVLKFIDLNGMKRRVTKLVNQMLSIFDALIKKRLQLRMNSLSASSSDILDALLDLVEAKSEGVDMPIVKHLLLDIFAAGTETTSSTLEWAMTELLRNPEKLSRAQAELHRVIGKDKQVEESDVSRLPYLQAVIKETFRLHPAVPLLLPRKSDEATEIGGFTIPKGAQVLINVWAIGRHPDIWVNPNEFMPERFLGSNIDVRGKNFELIPFGSGRRICPGLPLAMRMLHLMLGSLLNSFNWKLEDGVCPESINMEDKFGITVKKAQPLKAVPMPI